MVVMLVVAKNYATTVHTTMNVLENDKGVHNARNIASVECSRKPWDV